MRKFLVLLAFVAGLFALPAFAAEKKAEIKVAATTKGYTGVKDKAYWTRVWYEKQARKGKRYKKRVYKKRSSKKRRVAKRSKRKFKSRSGYGGRVLAKVDLSSQRMNVYRGGRLLHTWKVSTGRSGYGTPTGTWSIKRMHKRYFSKKYHGAPMPNAMFYHRGFAVHGTNAIGRLGRTASHGCVRLHPSNAAKLFSMVRRHGGTVKVTY